MGAADLNNNELMNEGVEGENNQTNSIHNTGNTQGDVDKKLDERSNVFTVVGADSNVQTQADSQVMTLGYYSQTRGRGTINSEELSAVEG